MTLTKDNSKVRLRRYEDDLYVSGTGIIIMGAWGVVKLLLGVFLGEDRDLFFEADSELGQTAAIILTVLMVGILSALIILLHVHIGLNAVRAARGKEYKKSYLIWNALLLLLNIVSFIGYYDMFDDMENIDSTIASILVDLTSVYVCLIVIISANRIKKIKQVISGGEEDHAD